MKRLDAFLSENSTLSRSDAKKALKAGRVTVNGNIVKDAAFKVGDSDNVALDKTTIEEIGLVYILMNKPDGVLSVTEDSRNRTVLDIIKESENLPDAIKQKQLFPIGRLDKDTEGLLVLTNDGKLAHELMSPAHHVEKEYYAVCSGTPSKNAAELFKEGIQVGEEYKAKPAKLEINECADGQTKCFVTLTEGRFHQVKRMCHEIGLTVTYLKRVRIGGIILPEDLKTGESVLMPDFPEKVKK